MCVLAKCVFFFSDGPSDWVSNSLNLMYACKERSGKSDRR